MVDVARDARWDRLAEGYGEDPYLFAVMGVGAGKGYQGDDLTRPDAVAACTKHFAGYGMSESGQWYASCYKKHGWHIHLDFER